MFGMLLDGPVEVFCDNQVVVKNVSLPEPVRLKKQLLQEFYMYSKKIENRKALNFCQFPDKFNYLEGFWTTFEE